MLHRRKAPLEVVKELDAFPKVPTGYVETTSSGGTISILTFILVTFLVVSEVRYYTATKLTFRYSIDEDYDSKLKINIDMTVAMPCDTIGSDILDVTNQNTDNFGQLEEEPTWFELTPRQKMHWQSMKNVNAYIRQEYHALHELLWKTGYAYMFGPMPAREETALVVNSEPDACRLHGTFVVNKVAGNFHITAGKSIPFPTGHAHLSAFLSENDYNFSHRIERFSFGEPTSGIFDPLDGDERITDKHFQLYQYYIQVVPTEVKTYSTNHTAYQFSVTEQGREIDHSGGSHGVPGIYFKYDMSSIKVKVSEEHEPYWQLLVRLCGIIGGMYTTSGILNSMVGFLTDFLCCRFSKKPKYEKLETQVISANTNSVSPVGTNGIVASGLDIPQVSLSAQNGAVN